MPIDRLPDEVIALTLAFLPKDNIRRIRHILQGDG
jgi:hypothetical protein